MKCRLAVGFCFGLLVYLVLMEKFRQKKYPIEMTSIQASERIAASQVYTYDNEWRRDLDVCSNIDLSSFVETSLLHIKNPMKMYVMDPKKDSISRIILSDGMFDKVDFDVMYKFFGDKTDYDFIDIGANVGVYSLKFADVGKRVFSVEVSRDLIQRICGSIYLNNFEKTMIIIYNAIGADHGNISYIMSRGDYGYNFVEDEHTKKVMMKMMGKKFYASKEVHKLVMLDDLLELSTFKGVKKVFMKVDVEGFEHKVIEGASKFFDNIEVGGVYMEWNNQGPYKTGEIIISFMQKRGFEPFHCPNPNKCIYLDIENVRKELYNIFWLPVGILKH